MRTNLNLYNFFSNAFRIALLPTFFLIGTQAIILANDSIKIHSSNFVFVKSPQTRLTVLPETVSNLQYGAIHKTDSTQNKNENKTILIVSINSQFIGGEHLTGAEIVYKETFSDKITQSQESKSPNEILETKSDFPPTPPLTENYNTSNSESTYGSSEKLNSLITPPSQTSFIAYYQPHSFKQREINPKLLFIHTEILRTCYLTNTSKERAPPPYLLLEQNLI